jgi:hypothetical protein
LHNILSLGRVVHEARHETHQPALILRHQQVECLPLTGLDAFDQQLITLAFCCH